MPDSASLPTTCPETPGPQTGPAERLCRLWRQGQQPDVGAFLAQAGSLPPQQVVAVLRADQRERWQAGDRVPAEAYLQRFPALQTDADGAIDLVYGEFLLREKRGERPTLDEYRQRFPQYAAVLKDQIEMHQALAAYGEGPSGGAALAPAPEALDDYEILGELGRGGMGVVLKGRDPVLGRELAIKVLRGGAAEDPDVVRRFAAEARITGRLQHPGIVPVYELGTSADQAPYFTMKLVQGQTLAELLAARGRAPASGGYQPPDLPRLLKIFEQVCQTLAYAHAHGVIHRDLKPANVMVGEFGEVQVMDWGLAKVVGSGQWAVGSEDRSSLPTAHCPRPTVTGQVLGTPEYMAPEQARGEVERLDERRDVFSLGALLCEILTGQPPYGGRDRDEVLRRARQVDLADAFARLDDCGADAEPVALAKACLAAEPEGRPRDAGRVAAAVTAYLTGVLERLRVAEIERAAAQAKEAEARATAAAERRARRLTAGLAAALLALVTLGGAGVLWRQGQKAEAARREEQARQGATSALEQVLDMQRRGRWAAARAFLDQAARPTAEAGPTELRQRLPQAGADLDLAEKLETIWLDYFSGEAEGIDSRQTCAEFARAFAQAGLAVTEGDAGEAAARVRDSAIADHLVAALDGWAYVEQGDRRARLLQVARLADPDPWRDQVRDPAVWQDRGALEQLTKEAVAADHPPYLLGRLARLLRKHGVDVEPLLRAAQRRHATDFWINFDLGLALVNKKPEEAVGFFRAALVVRPENAVVHYSLGLVLQKSGRRDEAGAAYHQSLQLNPNYFRAHTNLGQVQMEQGQWQEAAASFQRAAVRNNPKIAHAHSNLGSALVQLDRVEDALAAYRKAIEIDPTLAIAHNGLGVALQKKGELEEAIAALRRAAKLNPQSATAPYNLGTVLLGLKRWDEAIAAFRQAIERRPNYSKAYANLGMALQSKGEREQALAVFRKAIEIDPQNSLAHYNLGNALKDKELWEEAIASFRQALAINPKDAAAHGNLGWVLLEQGRFAEARPHLQRCLELLPAADPMRKTVQAQLTRCDQLLALDSKLAAILKGDRQPVDAAEQLALADLCRRYKKQYAAAAGFYAAAFAAQPKLADNPSTRSRYHAACAAALAGCGRGEDAAALDAPERTRWRKQALDWLRADLALWTKHAESATPQARAAVQKALVPWRQNADLAGLRDEAALAELPAEERDACRQLWADVDALLARLRDAE